MLLASGKELEQEREKRRYQRKGDYVKKMMEEKCLAAGLTLQKARDMLWALTGCDTYNLLVIERGRASDDYEEWLAQSLLSTNKS